MGFYPFNPLTFFISLNKFILIGMRQNFSLIIFLWFERKYITRFSGF